MANNNGLNKYCNNIKLVPDDILHPLLICESTGESCVGYVGDIFPDGSDPGAHCAYLTLNYGAISICPSNSLRKKIQEKMKAGTAVQEVETES